MPRNSAALIRNSAVFTESRSGLSRSMFIHIPNHIFYAFGNILLVGVYMSCSEADMSEKRKRQWLTVEDKLAIINQHENGTTFAKIARDKGMNESSVRKIVKEKEKYIELGKITASSSVKIRRKRSTILINMERLLSTWIEDCHQKRIPLSQTIIKHKALSLFNVMKEREGDNSEPHNFEASRGWFDRFRKRYEIHNVRICGESASADNEAAVKFPDILQRVIEEGGFTEQQIFNVDETGLFWKSMPTRTYVPKSERSQPGFKTAKERLTLLLGGNAAGDMKLKPMLVYRYVYFIGLVLLEMFINCTFCLCTDLNIQEPSEIPQ